MAFQEGETYKKVFGPVFVYVNSASSQNDTLSLWSDAAQQVLVYNSHQKAPNIICLIITRYN